MKINKLLKEKQLTKYRLAKMSGISQTLTLTVKKGKNGLCASKRKHFDRFLDSKSCCDMATFL